MRNRFVPIFAALAMAGAAVGSAVPAQAAPSSGQVPKLDTAHVRKPVKAPKGRPGRDIATRTLTPCVPNCFEFSEANQTLSAAEQSDGAYAEYSVSRPYLSEPQEGDQHTLAEMAVKSSDSQQIVEVGWIVDHSVDVNPHLFVFSWLNGVGQGYNGGNGYADAVGCSPCAGDSLNSDVGTTKSFSIEHIGTAWWLKYNGGFVGAYPDSSWSGTFTKARIVQVFGEIAAVTTTSCTDMGSGAHAGTSPSALIQNFALINSTATSTLTPGTITHSAEWAQTTLGTPVTGIRYGGEGWNSVGNALGVRDHCAPNAQGTPAASSFQAWQEECPDLNGTTGCTSAWSIAWASATIGTCVVIPNPGVTITNAVWNNSGSSGKTFSIYRTGTCGGSAMSFGNAAKAVLGVGWNDIAVRAYKRTA